MSNYIMITTILPRKKSCERLLAEMLRQSKRPDGVILILDGYGETEPPPKCPLPIVVTRRTPELTGCGVRWRTLVALLEEGVVKADDIVINLDDDQVTLSAPKLVENLVRDMEEMPDSACAIMGREPNCHPAPPGNISHGDLLFGAGMGFTVRPKFLTGLIEFNQSVKDAGGPDGLGVMGSDDAMLSAFLWKQKIQIWHTPTGNVYAAPNTHKSSVTAERAKKRESWETQKLQIAKITGWPWIAQKKPLARAGTFKRAPSAGLIVPARPPTVRR